MKLLLFWTLLLSVGSFTPQPASAATGVPILLYHRFGATVADSMTVTTRSFESHLIYLKEHGYTVIPLRRLVDWYLKKAPAPPPHSVVIVEDDAHKSVYTDMYPLIRKHQVPVTIFVYPSAISNATYAMTWDQLRELKQSGLVDVQSHSYWHPNFKRERKKLSSSEYEKLVDTQLRKSKSKLEKELGGTVEMLAWPFGIFDEYLIGRAAAAGYTSSFTIERHHAGAGDRVMKLPRYLMTSGDNLALILEGKDTRKQTAY